MTLNLHRHRPLVVPVLVAAMVTGVALDRRARHSTAATPQGHSPAQAGAMRGIDTRLSLHGEEAIAHLKQQGAHDSLGAALTRARYAITRIASARTANGEDTYEALNPAEDLRASFTSKGVRVRSSSGQQWQMGIELKAYGYGNDLTTLTAGEMTTRDNRIEIRKHAAHSPQTPALVEWYVNTPAGLEQGFTLPAPPPHDSNRDAGVSEPLRLVWALTGDLHGEASADGQAIALKDDHDRHVSTYTHLEAWDATGRRLAARMDVSGRDVALAVDDAGATYPVTIDPTFGQQQFQLQAPDGATRAHFGTSVAISGGTAVVGAPEANAAYVFVRSGANWVLQQELSEDEDGVGGDGFGVSVAIDGDTIIVGALGVDLYRDDGGIIGDVGAAYVYTRTGTSWSLPPERLTASDGGRNFYFGSSVALSGDTAIVAGQSAAHTVYVFARSGGTWSEQQILTGDKSPDVSAFGFTVALSGNTALVWGSDLGEYPQSAVYAFVRNDQTWSLQQKIVANDHVPGDRFGFRLIAISGQTAIVGYYHSSPNAALRNSRQGAYLFVRDKGVWEQQPGKLVAGEPPMDDSPGPAAVAISGNTAVVGFGNDTVAGHKEQGAAYAYVRSGLGWSKPEKLTAVDGTTNDNFGNAVAIGGDTVVVGAPNDDVGVNVNQGSAHIFTRLSDLDGDGLADDWEMSGVTLDGEFIDLPRMGANPQHKDVFVHTDWMAPSPTGVILKPNPRALKMVMDAFAMAPVDNPDGKTGIHLHVDLGPDSIMNPVTDETWGTDARAGEVPFQEALGMLDANEHYLWSAVDTVKAERFAQTKRSAVFHYALFCNTFANEPNSGISRGTGTGGADFLISLGKERVAVSPGGQVVRLIPGGTLMQQAGTFMHELGHNLGLKKHGGGDDTVFKPNYLSVMNYLFQFSGLLNANGSRALDYSRNVLKPLYQTTLDERVGIGDPAGHVTLWNGPSRPDDPPGSNRCRANQNGYYTVFLPAAALDWDCDGALTLDPVDRRLVNEAGAPDPLTGFEDWSHLNYDGGGRIGNLGAGGTDVTSSPNEELPIEQILSALPPALLADELVAPRDVATYAPHVGPAPLTVHFNGSSSTAPVGTIADWAWDFGDGTAGAGTTVQHTYNTPGTYFASLTVADDHGLVNLVPLLLRIVVSAPIPPTSTPTPQATSPPGPTLTSTRTRTPVPTPTPPRAATATPDTVSSPTPTRPPATPPSPTAHPTQTPVVGIGDVDPGFGPSVTSVYARPVDAVVTQPDRKIIVGGSFASFAGCARRNIARVNADGSCDTSFDPGLGLTVVHQSGGAQTLAGTHRVDLVVKALALQPDGKVLVGLLGADGFQNGVFTHSRIIVRLNTDGTIDSSFNAAGVPIGPGTAQSVNAIAIQGDGKILIGGGFRYHNGKIRSGTPYPDGAIARLHADGSVDASFVVPDGQSVGGPNYAVYGIALQPDGRLIIGGAFTEIGLTKRYGIARLNSDGSLDTDYNVQNPTTLRFASGFGIFTTSYALALQPNGKVVVSGALNAANGNPSDSVSVARLDVDGSRDTSFADERYGLVRALALQADDKLLIGGDFRMTEPAVRNSIARLNADGALDLTFDTAGMKGGVYLGSGSNNDVSAIALQANGQVVVAGSYDNYNGAPAENILQLETDGRRDASFDSNGAGVSAQVYAVVRQPDGKLLVGFQPGSITRPAHLNSARRGGIGRLHADGTTDATFTSPFDYQSTVFGIALQPDGKVIVGGSFRLIGSQSTMDFARLNADGTLDAGFVLPGPDVHLGNNTGFAVQADGKILAYEASIFGQGRLVRLNATGSRDDTFVFPSYPVEHIVVQPDGKILLTAQYAPLQRLNADGSLDATFDAGTGPNDLVRAIVLQPDGKILIGGYFYDYGAVRQRLARLNADGSLDTTFAPATPYMDFQQTAVAALALQPDGKVFVGMDFAGNSVLDLRNRVFRLNSDGSLDSSFPQDDTGFEFINGIPNGTKINALLVQPDHNLMVGGNFDSVDGVARLALVRLLGATPSCPGDCDGNGSVTVDELVKGVNIALDTTSVDSCPAMDVNGDGVVTINELIAAVNCALNG